MFINIYVYCTDERQKYLSKSLYGIKKSSVKTEFRKCDYNIWILPTPLYKYDVSIMGAQVNADMLSPNNIVFAGAINKEWKSFFEANNIEYIDLMEEEKVVLENADITAEATLMLYILNSKVSVKNQKIIISGYGRCGKVLAEKFSSLGAKITVLARSKEARKEAISKGYNAVTFSYGPQEAYGTVALINTVPERVISDLILSELHKECLLIEIASAPGGFDKDFIEKNGLKYIEAPGLT